MNRVGVLAAASVAVLLAGCVPQAPVTPSPSPPTFMCTPEAGGAQAPCSEQQFQETKAKDALYAEAEQVYRTYQAEFLKVIRAGGSDKLTPGLQAVIGSKDVENVVLGELKLFKKDGLRIVGPGAQVAKVTRRPSLVKGASLATLDFCVDSRSTSIFEGSRKVSSGILGKDTTYFGMVDERLRIVFIVGDEVKTC